MRVQLLRQPGRGSRLLRCLRADGAVCTRQRRRRRTHETPRGQPGRFQRLYNRALLWAMLSGANDDSE